MKKSAKKNNAKKLSLKERVKRMFGTRFKMGSYSAFAAAFVIAIAVIVNMVAQALPSTYTQFDLTSQSIFSISEQTKRIMSSLDKDVNLYLLATTGNEDDTITRLLQRYADLSSHIHVSNVDPSTQPTFLDNYELNVGQLYANSVLVESDGRYRLVNYTDIFVTSYDMDYYSYNYSTTTEFDGENALTNAIHYVTSDDLPKVYTLTGHGETELSASVNELIEQDNIETESLSLLSLENVPEDTGAIVINAPTSDLSEDEAQMLIDWLADGGKLVMITDYINEGEMTNLLSVAQAMGLTVQNGLIIEGDRNHRMGRYPHYLLPEIESHEVTSALIDGGYYILMPMAQGITETGDSNAEITFLLNTTSSAYAKQAGMDSTTTEKEEGDIEGTYHVGAVSVSGDTKLAWFSSSGFLDDSINRAVSGANGDLFMNILNWMCGQEESISIRSKSMDSTTLTVTGAQRSFWSTLLIGLIPMGFIAAGIIIWIRRKRR